MSCTDCFNGCGTPTPDTCVKYTGPDVPLLGIQTGDPISKTEESIINKLTEYSTGAGITLSDIDLKCDFIKDLLGCCKDKTLVNLIQVLIDANCTLKDLIDNFSCDCGGSPDVPFSFNTLCLTGLPASPTRDDIVQAIINKLCAVDATVNTIYSDYVKASQLDTLIAAYLASVTVSNQQYLKMVPFVAYEYYGPLTNFDGAGKGIPAAGYDKVYLCVGQTVNTFQIPDKRGRVAVGVPTMPGGGALPAAVDYTLPINAGCNYTLKQQFGENFNALTINQLPGHTHTPTVTQSPHSHFTVSSVDLGGTLTAATPISNGHSTGGNLGYTLVSGQSPASIGRTSDATTNVNVTIASVGNGNPVDNRQPSIAAYYIMYIP